MSAGAQCAPDRRVRCLRAQTRAGALSETLISPATFSFSPVLCVSTDNMVDQTKVEASEAKAAEMEKKVKYTHSFTVDVQNEKTNAQQQQPTACNTHGHICMSSQKHTRYYNHTL